MIPKEPVRIMRSVSFEGILDDLVIVVQLIIHQPSLIIHIRGILLCIQLKTIEEPQIIVTVGFLKC